MDAPGQDARIEPPESIDRAGVANEVGAAIAHQLNGPLTALLLYLEDLRQTCDRFPATDCNGSTLKQIAENAVHEAERVCALMERIGDSFEAPLREDTALAQGRDVIRWWSRARNVSEEAAPATPACRVSLTRREREVLRVVRDGCSNKEGGVRLQISHRTFESHRARLMRKFSARNVADLLRLAALDQPDEAAPTFQGTAAGSDRSSGTIRCKR
jgi:DNA-binding CsgD family transcriptional regulator